MTDSRKNEFLSIETKTCKKIGHFKNFLIIETKTCIKSIFQINPRSLSDQPNFKIGNTGLKFPVKQDYAACSPRIFEQI